MGEIVVPVAFHILCQLMRAKAGWPFLCSRAQCNLVSNEVRNSQVQHSFSHALCIKDKFKK